MRGHQISTAIQRTRYVITDLVTTALAFFLFNLFRYYLMDLNSTLQLSLGEYLSMPKMVFEQIAIPVALLAIYWLSGY